MLRFLPYVCLLLFPQLVCADWNLAEMLEQDSEGRTIYRAKPIEDRFRNRWPDEYEDEFQARARAIIAAQPERLAKGTTYFESEKRFYGRLMAQVLGNYPDEAMHRLQGEDHQADLWHRHTEGIDYYACFTLKHQIRKYFYFGDLMDPTYRRRMYDGGKKWTVKDPLRRPHYAFTKAGPGWGPDVKNSWVDVRSTENLFLMRVTSVYLMAEETGNAATTAKYKALLLEYAKTLYRIGIGEWDSENYHGHSIAPLCNLYDFAKDPAVKLAAKACLDWFMAAGAVKYYRGGFTGPGSRDYNHPQPFGGSAANILWVYFGDTPRFNSEHLESDEVHLITSAYRPPVAVMKLARKEFERPLELLSSKPPYSATTSLNLDAAPQFLETQYIANSYQMGSLSCGTPPGVSAVNGFKIIVRDNKHGCRTLHAAPTSDPNFAGSPMYREGKITCENRCAQFENLAIWLAQDGNAPWVWVIPEHAKVTQEDNVTFLDFGDTYVAVRGLGLAFKVDPGLTKSVSAGKKARFAEHIVLSAQGASKSYCGMIVEVGEKASHDGFNKFRRQVLSAAVDDSGLEDGVVRYRSGKRSLRIHWNDVPKQLGVWKNGIPHDWAEHAKHLYRPSDSRSLAPILAKWGDGTLKVHAGGRSFTSSVGDDGRVSFGDD